MTNSHSIGCVDYFDINRMMKFEEKFENEQVLEIF